MSIILVVSITLIFSNLSTISLWPYPITRLNSINLFISSSHSRTVLVWLKESLHEAVIERFIWALTHWFCAHVQVYSRQHFPKGSERRSVTWLWRSELTQDFKTKANFIRDILYVWACNGKGFSLLSMVSELKGWIHQEILTTFTSLFFIS